MKTGHTDPNRFWKTPHTEYKTANNDLNFSAKENGHVLAIRPMMLPTQKFTGKNLLESAIHLYHHAIFKATLLAAGINLVELPTACSRVYRYPRDPALILHPHRLILTTKDNIRDDCMDIVEEMKKYDYEHIKINDADFEVKKYHYEHIEINDAYFEGGNIIFDPKIKKGTFFHGMDTEATGYFKDNTNSRFIIPPQQTNQQLKSQLHKYGFEVHGLTLADRMLSKLEGFHVPAAFKKSWNIADSATSYKPAGFYYHLDCFMQLLPDGRLMILNKKILSEESQKLLEKIYGDGLIDLAYEDYDKNPIFLNFIATIKDKNNKIVIISPTLPSSLFYKLNLLGFTVITPDCLRPESEYYNKVFTSRVASHLKEMGFETSEATTLLTKLVVCSKGYLSDDSQYYFVKKSSITQVHHEHYSKQELNFCVDVGGPHCLTNDLVHCQNLSNLQCQM